MSCTLQYNLQAANSNHTSIQAKGPVNWVIWAHLGLTRARVWFSGPCPGPLVLSRCCFNLRRHSSQLSSVGRDPNHRRRRQHRSPLLSLSAQVRGWGFACVRVRPLPPLRWLPAPVTTSLPSTATASRCRP
uniref:Uncharacterized protein n=1 Tax=Opuntia streptacantha TaxID=393608 RepID=A0A7C9DMP5_OPUST